jgi:DNA repair protein RecN (Recombination protein N)
MLESLSIHNLALIEDLQIDFSEGFNVLSGETGAGKSIILGALGLLLGETVESSVVRSGAEEATVSALFSIPKESEIYDFLKELQIEAEEETLLLRRVVKRGGRSFVYIQSQLMRKADLNQIATALFDIHGQHQHQSLLYNPPRMLRLLEELRAKLNFAPAQ